MLGFDLFKMKTQRFEQNGRKHRDAVIFAFAVADDDLMISKVQVFDAQAHDFH